MKTALPLLGALLLASPGAYAVEPPRTFCNPLSIPDYPVAFLSRTVTRGEPDPRGGWILGQREQFRELADPVVLCHDGKWFLYPSGDMAWVSADEGATWRHHPLNVREIGYPPTVVRHRGRFLLGNNSPTLYASASPLGPFEKIGDLKLAAGGAVPPLWGKMLFSADDGRLFLYFGVSEKAGIWGVELDAADPTTALGQPVRLISFDPRARPWEALGEWNQDPTKGWLETAWMLKRNGRYYLTYSAAGTEYRTYALGCCVGDSPLGPFTHQRHNPILRTTEGPLTGTASGSIVAGPDRSLWAFYTIRAGVVAGPFRYTVELETAADRWTTIVDRSESIEDLLVDYRECKPTTGTRGRLVVLGWPAGITPGVAEFTLFGDTLFPGEEPIQR